MSEKRKWQQTGSEIIYEDTFVKFAVDDVVRPDGSAGKYAYSIRNGAVFVVAITTDGDMVFVEQDRYPIGRATIEMVAGGLEGGDNATERAAAELTEEAGASAEHLEVIGTLYSAPSTLTAKIYVVLATGVVADNLHSDDQESDEAINAVHVKSQNEVLAMVRSGEINDAATLAALNLYWAKYGFPKAD